MTTTLKCEVKENREAAISYDLDGTTIATATRTFIVISDDPTDSPDDVLLTPGLPQRHDDYPDIPAAKMTNIEASQDPDAWAIWTVTCSYDSGDDSQSPGGGGEPQDPTLRTAIAEMSFRLIQVPVTTRAQGQGDSMLDWPLRASNGEPFDPIVTADAHRPIFRVEQNLATVNLKSYADLIDNINSDDPSFTWGPYTFPQYTLKIQDIHVSKQFTENGISYRKVTWTIEYNKRTWLIRPVNIGSYYYEDTVDFEKKAFITKTGHPYKGFLKADGTKLDTDTDPPTVEEYNFYDEVAFAGLNLPPLP